VADRAPTPDTPDHRHPGVEAATTSGRAVTDAELARIVTVPNMISLVRLACIPLFLWILFGLDNRAGAAWLLGGLGATDWVDGYIARRWHQVSSFGKVLDPTADRLLFIVGVAAIIIDGSAPLWFAWAVVGREVVMSVALVTLTALGMKRFDVSWAGKAGTFDLMFAFPGFMLGATDFPGHTVFRWLGWGFGIPGLALSYYAAVTYLPMMKRNLAAGRRERAAAQRDGQARPMEAAT
jgi:cardiolipin synthase (CMP-forming)